MFQIGGIITFAINVLIWLVLRRRLKLAFPKHGNLYGIIAGVAMLLLLHPSLAMAIGSWSGLRLVRDALPEWAQILCMGAQFAAWVYAALHLVIVGPNYARRAVKWLMARRKTAAPDADDKPADESRRRMLARVGLAIPAAAVVIAGVGVAGYGAAPVVTRLRLPVRRDMTNLHGVRIAQVSDTHIGSYMGRARLSEFAEAMNALKADYHVITGDFVDNHIEQLELAQFLLRTLKPKREIFLCMGNHEYYTARSASMSEMLGGFEDAGGVMLIDEARELRHGGDRLWLGGIDYPRGRGNESGRETRDSLIHTIGQMSDDGAPRVILSHHPRTFYEGREADIDLMLSGHTHGGQINLGRIGDTAFTPVLPVDFYHNGFYEHNGRRLYVNSGAGGWLPVRINCPPEITLVELA